MNTKINIELEVDKAISGNKDALGKIVLEIKDMVYNLSLKMLFLPEDAKDATQEILVRIITHLGTYRQECAFKTWVYRVATNYLLSAKRKLSKATEISFEDYERLIDSGQSDLVSYTNNDGLLRLLEEEVKVSCTHGLLFCLSKASRIIYILGDILDFNGVEGAEILEITPENFRKKLSRARSQIRHFLKSKCGLVRATNPCRCVRKIDFLIESGKINPSELLFAKHSQRSIDLISKIDFLDNTVAVYKSVPNLKMPEDAMEEIRNIINTVNL